MKTGKANIRTLLLLVIFVLTLWNVHAQKRYASIIRSSLEEEMVLLTVDKPVYFPGDTVVIKVLRNDSTAALFATPVLIIEGVFLKSIGDNCFMAVIPPACPPGQYGIRLKIVDSGNKSYIYPTDCTINVEEHQLIEKIYQYVKIEPQAGSDLIETALTLNRNQIRNLRVVFMRDSIRQGMGPQFVTIKTTLLLRDGTSGQTSERRVVTFRNDKGPENDHALLVEYRKAYGAYAVIRTREISEVQLNIDSLPDWAVLKITVEPDYSINIESFDRTNSYSRYFRVKGPNIEIGFSLGIPKVLLDSQPNDTVVYGNYSAMVRFYHVDEKTGDRFPVNVGFGTFGVNSPIDINVGRGGLVLSIFLDVAEVTKIHGIGLFKKITAGLEVTPFFPIKRRGRILVNAQLGLSF